MTDTPSDPPVLRPPWDIPEEAADLEALVPEVVRQQDEVREIREGMDEEAFRWRPSPKKWSVAGHIAHLCLINRPYLEAMTQAASDARRRGLLSEGPYKHPWIGAWVSRLFEPPPKRRMKTISKMVPDPQAEDPVGEFLELQDEFARLLGSCQGLDLGRARFGSPFFPLLRFSLGAGFHLLLSHNRRHIWLAHEVIQSPGFPG